MTEDKPQVMKKQEVKQEVFHKRNLTDFLAGVAIGVALDLAMPYNGAESEGIESIRNALVNGLFISLPYGVLRGYHVNKKDGVRAFAAMYSGSFVGQLLVSVLRTYA